MGRCVWVVLALGMAGIGCDLYLGETDPPDAPSWPDAPRSVDGEPDDARRADAPPIDAAGPPVLRLTIEGPGAVARYDLDGTHEICTESCEIPLTGLSQVSLMATTPHTFFDWIGDCEGNGLTCTADVTGSLDIYVTFVRDEWSMVMGSSLVGESAPGDQPAAIALHRTGKTTGQLVHGHGRRLTSATFSGELRWSREVLARDEYVLDIAIASTTGAIYILVRRDATGTEPAYLDVRKLLPNGDLLWSRRTLEAPCRGVAGSNFRKNLAVMANRELAVISGNRLRVRSHVDGAILWSVPAPACGSVVWSPSGMIGVTRPGATAGSSVIRRYRADGRLLSPDFAIPGLGVASIAPEGGGQWWTHNYRDGTSTMALLGYSGAPRFHIEETFGANVTMGFTIFNGDALLVVESTPDELPATSPTILQTYHWDNANEGSLHVDRFATKPIFHMAPWDKVNAITAFDLATDEWGIAALAGRATEFVGTTIDHRPWIQVMPVVP